MTWISEDVLQYTLEFLSPSCQGYRATNSLFNKLGDNVRKNAIEKLDAAYPRFREDMEFFKYHTNMAALRDDWIPIILMLDEIIATIGGIGVEFAIRLARVFHKESIAEFIYNKYSKKIYGPTPLSVYYQWKYDHENKKRNLIDMLKRWSHNIEIIMGWITVEMKQYIQTIEADKWLSGLQDKRLPLYAFYDIDPNISCNSDDYYTYQLIKYTGIHNFQEHAYIAMSMFHRPQRLTCEDIITHDLLDKIYGYVTTITRYHNPVLITLVPEQWDQSDNDTNIHKKSPHQYVQQIKEFAIQQAVNI